MEELADVDSDKRIKRCTVTPMLSSRLHLATNGVLSSMDQLRFPNSLEVETGKPKAAVNALK